MQFQNLVKLVAIAFFALAISGGFAQADDADPVEKSPAEEVNETPPVDAAPPDSESGAGTSGDTPKAD